MEIASAGRSLTAALYGRTRELHRDAERTGLIADMLHGRADRRGYVLLLRNLHPAYQALEQGIERHRDSFILGPMAKHRLDRAGAIRRDLDALCGSRWANTVPMLPAGVAYLRRIESAAAGDGSLLIAHAYTRYLGDLNGGLILRRLLEKTLRLGPEQLAHYDFSDIGDVATLKLAYREALDQAGAAAPDVDRVVEEGAAAFACNIALSIEIQRVVSEGTAVAAADT
ncbi:heme oxygenase (biliverdin-producing) [Rhodopseudomonas sp. B29]|uniref:biliverdin-producing heme oxygenase n=1 Tax=Rhodopseudomonas sp. B29 TaxID=95607 RepID=UPI0003B5401A|nr:biliverdin-producing heme oxygenase [Rhodopseudomonas sp. B29]